MNTQTDSPLLTPFFLSGLQLRNRVVMAPMTRCRAGVERMPNRLMAEYYAQRASAGLIVTEGTIISDEACGWAETPGIENEPQADAWRQVVDAVHERNGTIFLQLWHCGRASHSSFHTGGSLPVAPSAVKNGGDSIHTPMGKQPYETPRALDTVEVGRVVDDFANAARRAASAGFDGVEIHGANGYLIDTFLQSRTNQRNDRYGGSVGNRLRLLSEIIEAVQNAFPSTRIGVRISPNGNYNDMGSPDYRESFTHYASRLNEYKLAYLHIMDGLAFGSHGLGDPMTLSEFRQVFSGSIVANCGYDRESADAAIAAGDADLVAFGRPFISNPDLVERFQNAWSLAPEAAKGDWYSHGREGYVDFPTYDNAPQ